jgi:indole-3-glycerol phosphate synthase
MLKIAESGITTPDDVARLVDARYDGVLVGEHLVTAPDPAEALRRLRAVT